MASHLSLGSLNHPDRKPSAIPDELLEPEGTQPILRFRSFGFLLAHKRATANISTNDSTVKQILTASLYIYRVSNTSLDNF